MRSSQMISVLAAVSEIGLTKSYGVHNLIGSSRPITQIRRWCQAGDEQLNLHQAKRKVCIVSPEVAKFEKISKDIAKDLAVPVHPIGEIDLFQSTEVSYDNLIHIIPYQFHRLDTYAIAIQPGNDGNAKSGRNGRKQKNTMQPFCIDFCPCPNSKMGKRLDKQSHQKGGESLIKAVAFHKLDSSDSGPVVYDLNAGFGQDSTLLALGGASKVYMVERDPIVGLLLSDALRRLRLVSDLPYDEYDDQLDGVISRAKELNKRLSLHLGDSVVFAKETRELLSDPDKNHQNLIRPDVCYLDPMFPPRTKSSAVKKNMQILHGLFQHDNQDTLRLQDERNLLEEALLLAKKKVVVKRPVNALPLGVQKDVPSDVKMPSHELKGSINRFDVYVIPQPHSCK